MGKYHTVPHCDRGPVFHYEYGFRSDNEAVKLYGV